MSSAVQKPNAVSPEVIEKVLIGGDLSKLSAQERTSYYGQVCQSLGLNPLTKPFDYIVLNNKLTLYAKRDATDQLRKVHNISITITDRQKIEDIYIVTARSKNAEGREDESTGAVNLGGLKGEALANALMKAETKAKRRVTLSICGLGLLDETEVETIKGAEIPSGTSRTAAIPNNTREIKSVRPAYHDLGDYTVPIGKKYMGQKLSDVPIDELVSFLAWLEESSENQGKPLFGKTLEFVEKVKEYIEQKNDDQSPPDFDINEEIPF